MESDLQHVADDTDAPHISEEVDRVKADDFRRHELGRPIHDPRLNCGVVVACQTEVDNLDAVTGPTETQDVLRLNVRAVPTVTDSFHAPTTHRQSYIVTEMRL